MEIPALISSYLGRTGQNLREVFDFARANQVVVLLDEFDAVAKRRDDQADLGELRRVVSVLLKEIEEWPGPSVLVAATNGPELVDPAIFRRFQLVMRVEPPGEQEAGTILRMHRVLPAGVRKACVPGVHASGLVGEGTWRCRAPRVSPIAASGAVLDTLQRPGLTPPVSMCSCVHVSMGPSARANATWDSSRAALAECVTVSEA